MIVERPADTPTFVALTAELSARQRANAALGAIGAATGLIVGFAPFGQVTLDFLHVSLPSLSIEGGLLLLLVALEMLRDMDMRPVAGRSVASVPLATHAAGRAGAIATVIGPRSSLPGGDRAAGGGDGNRLRRAPAEQLAAELRRRRWGVTEPMI